MDEGEFITEEIKNLLLRFVANPNETKILLDQLYLYSEDAVNSQGEISKGFRFLQNLRFNRIYWMERNYLKGNFGKKWQIEYRNY